MTFFWRSLQKNSLRWAHTMGGGGDVTTTVCLIWTKALLHKILQSLASCSRDKKVSSFNVAACALPLRTVWPAVTEKWTNIRFVCTSLRNMNTRRDPSPWHVPKYTALRRQAIPFFESPAKGNYNKIMSPFRQAWLTKRLPQELWRSSVC